MEAVLTIVLAVGGLWIALPTLSQLWSLAAALWRPRHRPPASDRSARLLFLVPAHNEELLVGRCLASLFRQDYPRERFHVVVVADNCEDGTADAARGLGAAVLERSDPTRRGKHSALDWAYRQLPLADYDAAIIVDADTIVNPEFATRIAEWPDLADRAIQTAADFTNEFETWLTRLAGLFNRYHYRVEFALKARAGLGVPLTGNGTVIGTRLLARLGWQIETITEGWELYARYTAAGLQVDFEPRALHITQEARSVKQGETQRSRWSAGRLHVAQLYGRQLAIRPGIALLQRFDAISELVSGGPVFRAMAGMAGSIVSAVVAPPGKTLLVALWATGFVQPAVLSLAALSTHPERLATVFALARLPGYALWRVTLGLRRAGRKRDEWVRTQRHIESN